MKPIIFTITGPSCSGKSTLEKLMVERLGFENVISHTTRQIRAGEVDGVNYYYITKDEFEDAAEDGDFIETVEFNDHNYGVSSAEIQRVASKNKPIVIVVEPEGMFQINDYATKHGYAHFAIFVDADEELIASRFIKRIASEIDAGNRNFEPTGAMAKRLAVAWYVERDWVNTARMLDEEDNPYNYIAYNFDSDNQNRVLDDLEIFLNGIKAQARYL